MLTICFTGHRPDKLGGYNWSSQKNMFIMAALRKQIIEVINTSEDNKFKFICGGALGIDQMAFCICEDIHDIYDAKIILELAMPFEKQSGNWLESSKKELARERREADCVVLVDKLDEYKIKGYIEGEYYPAKMQKRNEYMVDNSDIVIAVYDGSKGGTGNCVNYAKKQGKKIIQIDPKEIV